MWMMCCFKLVAVVLHLHLLVVGLPVVVTLTLQGGHKKDDGTLSSEQ